MLHASRNAACENIKFFGQLRCTRVITFIYPSGEKKRFRKVIYIF